MDILKILSFSETLLKAIITKNSDLQSNMSLRVLHSLIPSLTEGVSGEFSDSMEAQNFYAYDLIPGAKEVLQYGSQAVLAELNISKDEDLKARVNSFISSGNYKDGLALAAEGFIAPSFESAATGGEPWAKFSRALIDLYSQIEKAEHSGRPEDARMLSAYLNAIDGMAHNTSDFLEKLVQQESGYLEPEKVEELRKLRDLTRLPAEHVLTLMQGYSRHSPQYRRLFNEYRRRNPVEKIDFENAYSALREYQEQKRIKDLTVHDSPARSSGVSKRPTPRPPRPASKNK